MTKGKAAPLLGAHVSIAGGVHTAPQRGVEIGADVVQIFSKQNTRWEGKALEPEDAKALGAEQERTGVRVVAIHCAYLINLASSKEEVRTRSLYALEDEANRAALLGVPYLVMHPGSSGDDPVEVGISRIAEGLKSFGRFPKGVTLLLENTAGQGNSLGRSMEQMRALVDACGAPSDVAACLDTAHLFQSGYDLPTDEGFDAFLAEAEAHGILPLVRLWHLNDSKTKRGSRVDRHEHIGQGAMGTAAFTRLLRDVRFRETPMVIETPKDGDDEFAMDRVNLATLRQIFDQTKETA